MIKENQKLFNRLNVITDAAAAFLAITAAFLLVFSLLDFDRNYPISDYFKLLLIFVPLQLITYGCMGLYDSFRSKRFSTELGRLTAALVLDGLALTALLYVVRIINFSRWALAIFLLLDFLLVTIKRYILRKTLRKFRESGYNRKYVLIVGSGQAAQDYLSTIKRERWLGLECAGFVAEKPLPHAKCMGGYDQLLSVLEERSYDEVVCALDTDETDLLSSVVEACELTGTKISVIPIIYRYMSASPAIDMVGDIPLMNIRRIPLDNIGNAALKRAVDILGSLVLLVLTSPIMLVSMAVIKLTMGGNVIFKQKRVGLNKKVFTMYKLKSMRDSKESDTAWSTDTDPRRTRFGAFIRKFSIDELPQLINVLKGEMSLVGPRPEIPFYVNDFKDKIPMYMIKHQVKPGMTGLAQINGCRGDTSIEKRIQFDVQYIENWSFFLDISILLRTALSGFMNKEKLNRRKKPYKPENHRMNNKAKTDITALAMFLPSVIALAIIPIVLRITNVFTTLRETYMYNGGTEVTTDSGTGWNLLDVYSQGKAMVVVVLAIVMLAMSLLCCLSLFRRVEKRSLVYVGCSVVYVIMALASAAMSEYSSVAFSGEYDRAEGFWTTACYFVLFLFTMYAFRTTGNFKFVAIALFVCVGVNFVLGLSQVTGHNILEQNWFMNIIADSELREHLETTSYYTAQKLANGALYHSNYMGSFTGLVIPLLTVMAMYEQSKLFRVLFIVFDAMAVFLMVGSGARSGLVAVAAALVVGIIVFARQIAKHWKRCAALVAAAAIVLTGANFVMGNKLFTRIPSLFSDAAGIFLPAAEEDKDLYSKLPLREISTPSDGTLVLTGQNDVMTMAFDKEQGRYTYTSASGEPVHMVSIITFDQTEYSGLRLEADLAARTVTAAAGGFSAVFDIAEDGSMTVRDCPENGVLTNGAVTFSNISLGAVDMAFDGTSLAVEYDTEYGMLFFTDENGADVSYIDTASFPDTDFKDVYLRMEASEESSLVRDVIALNFWGRSNNSLFFDLVNEKRIEMIHFRTADEFVPVNAEHIGFEGKEKLGSSRGYIWSRTLPLLKNCMLTGYGADTFTYVFPQSDVLAKYYSYADYDQGFYITVDKPHNLYLQIFVSNGLIALIAFLGIVLFYLVDCFRLYALKKEYRPSQIMGAAVMLGIVGYLAAGMFNDSVVSVAPVFWVLLGVGAALNTINRRADRNVALDEDYAPVKTAGKKVTAAQQEKDKRLQEQAEALVKQMQQEAEEKRRQNELDLLERLSQREREEQERRSAAPARRPSKEDISSLLESVMALTDDQDKKAPENKEDSSNDND